MPTLGGDPARSFRRKAQYGPGDLVARKYAVARSQHFVEPLVGDILGLLVEDFGMFDGVDREGAQSVAQMAPGVEVPVVAVVIEALRRDFPFGDLVGAPGVVADHQALAAEQGGADRLEMVEMELAGADRLDADAALHFLDRVVGGAEQAGEAGEQGLDLRAEQAAGVEVREEVLHGQQGMDFLGGEPQARQLVLRADPLTGLLEAIATQIAVEDQRRVQAVAHVGDVAFQGRPGDAEALLKFGTGDEGPVAQHLVDLVDAFHAAHIHPFVASPKASFIGDGSIDAR